MKKVFGLVFTLILFLGSTGSVLASNNTGNNSADKDACIDIEVSDISSVYVKEFGLENRNITEMQIVSVQASKTDTRTKSTASQEDAGVLVVESFDEENELKEVSYFMLLEENGQALTTNDLTERLVNTELRKSSYVEIQGRFKLYTDGLFYTYVNPYELSMTASKSGLEYMSGDMTFHGTQVSTSDFVDIPGTSCSNAYKMISLSGEYITVGKTYKNTGYFYSGKALRTYACGIHGGPGNMYLEYKTGGKIYKYTYDIANI